MLAQAQTAPLDSSQAHHHHQPENGQQLNHGQPPPPSQQLTFPTMSPSFLEFGQSPPQSPPATSHSRTSSFFSFRNRQSLAVERPSHQRKGSAGNVPRPSTSPNERNLNQPRGFAPQFEQQQQQQQQQAQPAMMHTQPASTTPPTQGSPQQNMQAAAQPPPLHPEIRSVVTLTNAHAHKIYFAGSLVRRTERLPDGSKPTKDDGWTEVWAQLGGTTLSVWDMKQVQEANRQGKEVPPTYINITDAFVQVLGSVTIPGGQKYSNVLTLNNAGSNLLLFSCPSPAMLISWAAALRLSAWEKSRLEEIYTAHLVRLTLNAPNSPTTLVHGRMEGWVRVRTAGTTDWKRIWMIINAGSEGGPPDILGPGTGSPPTLQPKKSRLSSMFSREIEVAAPVKARITMHAGNKPKEKKKTLLTVANVTQAFGVYPERPELISRSTLIKVEGTFQDEEMAGTMKSRDGWLLIMPELEGGLDPAAEMLKWVTALHDAFELYGRPEAWMWDPRNPTSLMFAYPVGPHKDLLFLDRELAESLDPRDDRTSSIRSSLINVLLDRMRGNDGPSPQRPNALSDRPPSLSPIGDVPQPSQQQAQGDQRASTTNSFRLPPIAPVGSSLYPSQEKKELSPINERDGSTVTQSPIHSVSHGSNLMELNSTPNPHPHSPPPLHSQLQSSTPSSPQSLPSRQLLASGAGVQPSQSFSSTQNSIRPAPTMQSVGSTQSFDRQTQSTSSNLHEPVRRDAVSKPLPDPTNISLPMSPTPETSTVTYLNPTTRPRSPSNSVLTSPFSDQDHDLHRSSDRMSIERSSDRLSILTSPHSPSKRNPSSGLLQMSPSISSESKPTSFTAPTPNPQDDSPDLFSEAGALYYMSQLDGDKGANRPVKRLPTMIAERSNENGDSEGTESSLDTANLPSAPIPAHVEARTAAKAPASIHQNPIPESSSNSATSLNSLVSPSRPGFGRKPSGARAQAPPTRSFTSESFKSSPPATEEEDESSDERATASSPSVQKQPIRMMSQPQTRPSADDPDLDALAALQYLSTEDKPPSPTQIKVEPLHVKLQKPASPPLPNPVVKTPPEPATQYKSSFAPSKQATERKAKAQAQQAAHLAAVTKPGRANRKRASKIGGVWNESSDEEEDEEDEDDEEVNSDDEPIAPKQYSQGSSNVSLPRPSRSQNPSEVFSEPQPSHLRPPRTLPQIPGSQYSSEEAQPTSPRHVGSDQFLQASARRTYFDGTPIRTQAEVGQQPGAARQNVWSQVLEPGRGTNATLQQPSDTFVRLEPAEAMTKAFTPQGLLSAGLQDKQDRSAKKQEELARETGASLINVPNKPPPPQMGLLGAITAHERERKREGGVGATLTEREREKRLAEDRQRRFDEAQRQQLDQMQQGGSMYGYPGYGMMGNPMMMMNPMMMNPMMTGGGMNPMLSPMMTGQMGYPGMMPGFNPQHMFAAQQAATQAYQQAMMAFSVAGSQAGGDGQNGNQSQFNPAMQGSVQGNMGFDPRMSMMGMPMMGSPMGMMPQMTGMSTFDARFPPSMNNSPSNQEIGLTPPAGINANSFSSRTSSPAQHGSPLARPPEGASSQNNSRPETPKS